MNSRIAFRMILVSKEIRELMFKQKHKMFPDDSRLKDVTEVSGKEVRVGENRFGNVLALTQSKNLDIREVLECLLSFIHCPH